MGNTQYACEFAYPKGDLMLMTLLYAPSGVVGQERMGRRSHKMTSIIPHCWNDDHFGACFLS